jgi:hypothetical protein
MSRRRYKMAENPHYHRLFDAEKSFSIKDPAADRSRLSNRPGCESLRGEILEKIQDRTRRVQEIEQQFEQHRERCRLEGRVVPKQMDTVTHDKWLAAIGRQDVAMEELDLVDERLKAIAAAEQRISDKACLEYGPLGIGRLNNGVLAVIDGQNVVVDDEGVLRIVDGRSPYNGMRIEDYKQHVVGAYHRDRGQMHQKQMEDLLQRQREHPELALPENPPALRTGKIDKSTLPPWPEAVPRAGVTK